MPRRFSIVFTLVALAGLLLAACAVQQEQPKEEAAEEAGVEEKGPKGQPKEKAQGESAFVGEHENLKPGDTAEWNAGMTITVEDAYIAPNERRRAAEERQASREAKAKEGRKVREDPKGKTEPGLDEPEQLIGLSWTIANEGQEPINFNNELPCTALDANGVQLSRSAGSTAGWCRSKVVSSGYSCRKAALHQESGAYTRGGRSALNKALLLVVACDFGARLGPVVFDPFTSPALSLVLSSAFEAST